MQYFYSCLTSSHCFTKNNSQLITGFFTSCLTKSFLSLRIPKSVSAVTLRQASLTSWVIHFSEMWIGILWVVVSCFQPPPFYFHAHRQAFRNTHTHTERQSDTDRQKDTHVDKVTFRQTDRQTHTNRQTELQTDRQTQFSLSTSLPVWSGAGTQQ